MQIVKIISNEFDSIKRRIVKFYRYGVSDVQTSIESGPYGIDSNPIKDTIAIYSDTSGKGDTVIVGYLLKNKLAEVGETRIFSTNKNGELKTYIWLKNDGTIEMGGKTDHMVRFSSLELGFNTLVTEFNALVTNYNAHQHMVVAPGLVTTPGTPPAAGVPAVATIAAAKIDEIKTL